jgi:hypothetical protein
MALCQINHNRINHNQILILREEDIHDIKEIKTDAANKEHEQTLELYEAL